MGSMAKIRPLRPGVYAPMPTFFVEKEDLDLQSYKRHLLSMSIFGDSKPRADEMTLYRPCH